MCLIILRLDQWYSCTKMQYKELHGMLGHPVRAAKSLIVSEREDLARTLLFVLRYFCENSTGFCQNSNFVFFLTVP